MTKEMRYLKGQFLPLMAAYLISDVLRDLIKFPAWWYTTGLVKAGQFVVKKIKEKEKTVGFTIWIISLFKPMFGQRDWQGKLISFFIRFILLIVKTVQMVVWTVFYSLVFLVWVFAPPFILYQIFFQLSIL